VKVDLETGVATNSFGMIDNFANIERVIGSSNDDVLMAANSGSVLDGRGGNDTLISRDGKSQLFGGAGNDTLISGTKTGAALDGQGDTLVGGQGDDSFDGGNHLYTVVDYGLEGGARAVSVNMGTGFAEDSFGNLDTLKNIGIVKGTAQGDWMKGGVADIIFDGGAGNDTLFAGTGASELYGAAGDDTLFGGDGRPSFLEGGAGNDIINVGAAYTVVALYDSDGFDVVNGFKATDALRLYNSDQTAEELLAAATYHMADDGRDGLLFTYGDTKVFLAGVYDLKAEQIQFVNV
jgi:Ca2+-binding RTX toxin-like protein